MNCNNFTKDYLSVTEFAKIAGMTAETLRHYDRTDVFHPEKTGHGKYRHYNPTQITTIKIINVLTEIGVSLDTIGELANCITQRT